MSHTNYKEDLEPTCPSPGQDAAKSGTGKGHRTGSAFALHQGLRERLGLAWLPAVDACFLPPILMLRVCWVAALHMVVSIPSAVCLSVVLRVCMHMLTWRKPPFLFLLANHFTKNVSAVPAWLSLITLICNCLGPLSFLHRFGKINLLAKTFFWHIYIQSLTYFIWCSSGFYGCWKKVCGNSHIAALCVSGCLFFVPFRITSLLVFWHTDYNMSQNISIFIMWFWSSLCLLK